MQGTILQNGHQPGRARPTANVVAFTGTIDGLRASSRSLETRCFRKKQPPEVSIVRSSAAAYLTIVSATGSSELAVEMRYEDENIWLSQKMMATLYDVTVPVINQHLKRIFADRELVPDAVIKQLLATAADGKTYNVKHYSLQAIIAVAFKIENERAVQFRKWATW